MDPINKGLLGQAPYLVPVLDVSRTYTRRERLTSRPWRARMPSSEDGFAYVACVSEEADHDDRRTYDFVE